jgi:SAM-dependent methyltransferase
VTLEWTGERFIPGQAGASLYYEHAHRYALASLLADGRVVLDVGSGEGYGTARLASVAASVVGFDIAPEAVAHAAKTYGEASGLTFGVADAERLPIASGSIDVVTCFEVIEHVARPLDLLAEVERVLRPDGVFLVSTPDKDAYGAARHHEPNEFHLSEMHLDEFRAALAARFSSVVVLGQRLVGGSVVWPIDCADGDQPVDVLTVAGDDDAAAVRSLGAVVPILYAVAICTNGPPPAPVATTSVFLDRRVALYDELFEAMERAHQEVGRYAAELERLQHVERDLDQALHESLMEAHRLRTELYIERTSTGGAALDLYRRGVEWVAPTGSRRRRAYLVGPQTLKSLGKRVRRRKQGGQP